MGLARGLEILFHRRQLIANLRESVALAQARCCGGLGTGGNGETIPTPKRSIAADKTLSFSERRVQIAADFGRLDDADGGKPPCERRWAFNERREGFRTLRQRCGRSTGGSTCQWTGAAVSIGAVRSSSSAAPNAFS